MSEAAVTVDSLSKRFVVAAEPATTLRERLEAVLSGRVGRHEPKMTIDALRDISFEVAEGEAFGVIGRNGAGKTTLLSILSRVTAPTHGRATIYGRVGALLAVGAGFHPELTGRENVFLNGTVLGMRRAEVARKFDEIVAFSEVGNFIDIPVKRYSSGMYVRLGFAIAAHLEPEILLLDEVLSVGDRQFREKCHTRIDTLVHDGRTVLFVSHDTSSVLRMCSRTLVLERGEVAFIGESAEAAEKYASLTGTVNIDTRGGTGEVRIARVHVSGPAGRTGVPVGGALQTALELETTHPIDASDMGIEIDIRGERGLLVRLSTALALDNPLERDIASGTTVVCVIDRLPLKPGEYWLSARIRRRHELVDEAKRIRSFWVVPDDIHGSGALTSNRDPGVLVVPHRWRTTDVAQRSEL